MSSKKIKNIKELADRANTTETVANVGCILKSASYASEVGNEIFAHLRSETTPTKEELTAWAFRLGDCIDSIRTQLPKEFREFFEEFER